MLKFKRKIIFLKQLFVWNIVPYVYFNFPSSAALLQLTPHRASGQKKKYDRASLAVLCF